MGRIPSPSFYSDMAQQSELNTTLTVSQLTGSIQQTLEQNYSSVWVKGEISNLTRHSSGHWYFSLKDRGAQVGGVMFRRENQRVRFEMTHGMEVTVHGRISVYPPHGKYQLIVDQMLPAGQGDLHLALEALKKKLFDEGAFSAELKLPLPKYPKKIGIVTSPTGAAIQDMLNILKRRYPVADITLVPVRVQGESAAAEISNAIRTLDRKGEYDVLIVGRGGGSLEDLWAFNEEIVARAILAARTPIVSAVGHETDTTISDYVADERAPTPSAAAELVVPDQRELFERYAYLASALSRSLMKRIGQLDQRLTSIRDSYALKRPMLIIDRLTQTLDHDQNLILRTLAQSFRDRGTDLEMMEQRLNAVNPLQILDQGYAVMEGSDRRIVKSIDQVSTGDLVQLRVQDGTLGARIESKESKKNNGPSP